MKPSKTETKPTNTTISFHGNMLLHSHEGESRSSSSSSPTFAREACTKPLSQDKHHIIFGIPSGPTASLRSLDALTMDFSLSSHNSNHSAAEKMNTSFSSVGLPSEYPVHRKNTSFSSVTVEEELQDFELFNDEINVASEGLNSSCSSMTDQPPLESRAPTSPSSCGSDKNLKKDTKRRQHHRRNRTEVGALDNLVAIAKPSRGHRRRNNAALGARDFHESVLTELFEDVSLNEFRY